MDFEPDTKPLADGLRKIAKLIDTSESDPTGMLLLLNKIDDAIEDARSGWMKACGEAQASELAFLRSKSGMQ